MLGRDFGPDPLLDSQKKLGSIVTLGPKYEFLKTDQCPVAVTYRKQGTEGHTIVLNSVWKIDKDLKIGPFESIFQALQDKPHFIFGPL